MRIAEGGYVICNFASPTPTSRPLQTDTDQESARQGSSPTPNPALPFEHLPAGQLWDCGQLRCHPRSRPQRWALCFEGPRMSDVPVPCFSGGAGTVPLRSGSAVSRPSHRQRSFVSSPSVTRHPYQQFRPPPANRTDHPANLSKSNLSETTLRSGPSMLSGRSAT